MVTKIKNKMGGILFQNTASHLVGFSKEAGDSLQQMRV